MGNTSTAEASAPVQQKPPPAESKNVTDNKPQEKKLKPCCACPETREPRDRCIMEKGEENCQDLIEAHKECMRKMGFKI